MKYIILLSFLFLIPVSQAKVHVEPYGNIGGYYSGSKVFAKQLSLNYTLGARLGYQVLSIATGLDFFWTYYSTGYPPLITQNNSTSDPVRGFDQVDRSVFIIHSQSPEPFQPFSIGAFAAVELPFLVNAYGTLFYSFGDKDSISYQGYGVKAGVSWLSTFYIQVNAELQWSQYICGGETEAKCIDRKSFDTLSAMLSISVPLSFDVFDFGNSTDSSDDLEEEGSEVE